MHRCTQIVIIKLCKLFILALMLIFPTPTLFPYQQIIWDYKKADSKSIPKTLDLVNLERLFDQKLINVQVVAFNETISNVFP